MPEAYIQDLFAERIGGSQYGKSAAIYKFEKIKRAKRAALAAEMLATVGELPNGVLAVPRLLSNLSDAPMLGVVGGSFISARK